MDFELISKALLLGAKIKRCDNLFSNYRLHNQSKSMHDMKFLEEWALVVCTIFNSFENGKLFASKLDELGIAGHVSKANKYETSITFTNEELEDIFLQHINLQYHYNYKALDYNACKTISNYLKKNYSGFYETNNFNKYNFRLNFIPKFVFKTIRKLNT